MQSHVKFKVYAVHALSIFCHALFKIPISGGKVSVGPIWPIFSGYGMHLVYFESLIRQFKFQISIEISNHLTIYTVERLNKITRYKACYILHGFTHLQQFCDG